MTNNEMDKKIATLRALEAQIATLSSSVEDIKKELKAELDSRKVDSVQTDLHKLFYNCFEKTIADSDKLKAAGIFADFSKKSVITQFKITDVKA